MRVFSQVLLLCLMIFIGSCKTREFGENGSSVKAASQAKARAILDKEAGRFKNAYYRMSDDHNDTYFRLRHFYGNNRLEKTTKRTVIHFDYHADMYRNDSHLDGNINIGNYINTMIWEKDVGTVYWILPEDSYSDDSDVSGNGSGCSSVQSKRALYWERTSLTDWQFRDGPQDQIICVTSGGHFDFMTARGGDPLKECGSNYERAIPVHKRHMGQLLAANHDMKISHPVILDIDADFFGTSGAYANLSYDREPRCYNLAYSPERLAQEFERFATVITTKMNLRPDYISVARSPGYTYPPQNLDPIFDFLDYLGSKGNGQ